jgi:hypothetical protein
MTTADDVLEAVAARRKQCEHMNFRIKANVFRLTKQDGGKAVRFTADIRVMCADCGHPFVWKGLPYGYSPVQPMLSIDGQELRAPIEPSNFELERFATAEN